MQTKSAGFKALTESPMTLFKHLQM